jgi:hypothetical protein
MAGRTRGGAGGRGGAVTTSPCAGENRAACVEALELGTEVVVRGALYRLRLRWEERRRLGRSLNGAIASELFFYARELRRRWHNDVLLHPRREPLRLLPTTGTATGPRSCQKGALLKQQCER